MNQRRLFPLVVLAIVAMGHEPAAAGPFAFDDHERAGDAKLTAMLARSGNSYIKAKDWPFLVLAFALCGGGVWLSVYLRRKRIEKTKAIATARGFTFRPAGTDADRALLAGTNLAARGKRHVFTNIMEAPPTGGERMKLLDFSYTSPPTGKNKRQNGPTFVQTVSHMESPKLNLPAFVLRPNSIFDNVVQPFGLKDIDFESHPTFSKMFLLGGPDEAAIRALFTPPVMDYCGQHKNTCIEGGGNRLMIYRLDHRLKPEAIEAFCEESKVALAIFLAAQK